MMTTENVIIVQSRLTDNSNLAHSRHAMRLKPDFVISTQCILHNHHATTDTVTKAFSAQSILTKLVAKSREAHLAHLAAVTLLTAPCTTFPIKPVSTHRCLGQRNSLSAAPAMQFVMPTEATVVCYSCTLPHSRHCKLSPSLARPACRTLSHELTATSTPRHIIQLFWCLLLLCKSHRNTFEVNVYDKKQISAGIVLPL